MSDRLVAAAAKLLETLAIDSGEAEIDAAFDSLKEAARSAGRSGESLLEATAAIRRALKDDRLSERGLNYLIDTTHDLSSTLTLHDLLRTVVVRARSLGGADVAWVTVLDEAKDDFRVVTADGHLSPATAAMTTRVDQGAVSLMMSSRSYFETQDYLNDTRFRHSANLDGIFRTEKITSLAGFPIVWENKLHGFLFVANRYARKLSGREMSVLGTFALHAGVAMRNAQAFARMSEALDEAQHSRNALIEHIQRVETSAAAHDEMTGLLASGAEIRQFLEKMANRIGGAVFLHDDEFTNCEEFVSKDYDGDLAEELRAGRFDIALLINANAQSRHTGRSVALSPRADERCRAIALHGGKGRRDGLVICHRGELDAIEIRNLERSSVALSIAILWHERREAENLIASSTLLRHLVLVAPPDHATLSALRERLGLRGDSLVQLAIVAVAGDDRAAQTSRIRNCASGLCVLVDLLDEAYVAVGPVGAMQSFLHNLAQGRAASPSGGILSDPFSDLTEAAAQYARISKALQVLRRMKTLDRFLNQSEVNLFAKLFEVGDAARLSAHADHVLSRIGARAPRQRDELRKTMLVYFDAQHNMKRTAQTLGLHINTVRQRLDAVREMTGGWDDPVKALELHVALRLKAILDGGGPTS